MSWILSYEYLIMFWIILLTILVGGVIAAVITGRTSDASHDSDDTATDTAAKETASAMDMVVQDTPKDTADAASNDAVANTARDPEVASPHHDIVISAVEEIHKSGIDEETAAVIGNTSDTLPYTVMESNIPRPTTPPLAATASAKTDPQGTMPPPPASLPTKKVLSPLPIYKEPAERPSCLKKLGDLGALGAMYSAGDRAVYACPISPDGKLLASAHQDRGIRLWCMDTWECVCSLGEYSPKSIQFSPDGTQLLSRIEDNRGTAELWYIETGECDDLSDHDDEILDLRFSQDGKMIVSGSLDCTARLWCVETCECRHVLEGHTDAVCACCFSPDGTLVATGSDDKTVRIWRADSGKCLHVLQGHIDHVIACRFSPNSKLVVSCGDFCGAYVRVWRVDTGECVHVTDEHAGAVAGCEFSPNGELVATFGGEVMLWRPDTGEVLHVLGSGTRACAFSPDGALLAAACGISLKLFSVDTGEHLFTFEHENGTEELINDCHFSPDGRVIASCSNGTNGHVCIWGPFV